MIFLKILLSIILLIVILFCLPLSIVASFDGKFVFTLKYLGITIYKIPSAKKKTDKKKSKKKDAKKDDDSKKDEKSEENKKNKQDNMFKKFYQNQGLEGMLELIKDVLNAVNGAFKSIFKHFIVKHLYLDMMIASDDAASTAIKYGRVSGAVFPAMGLIVSAMRVKKYDIDISPDFLANKDVVSFYVKAKIRPIVITNALVVLAFKLLRDVLFKVTKVNKKAMKMKQDINKQVKKETKNAKERLK